MSRSRRHTPITGVTCSDSEKWEKRKANRKLRRLIREAVRKMVDSEDEPVLPEAREVSDVWDWSKDGKIYWGEDEDPKLFRK